MTSVDSDVIQALDELNINALRAEWRKCMDGEPPKLRAPDLLRRLLAERLQENTSNRDIDLERRLADLVHGYFRGEKVKIGKIRFRPGTILERAYGGKTYVAEVLDQGFRFNGQVWGNLSLIAREITGTRWNGPRFFGLRAPGA